MLEITALELEVWANSYTAEFQFPNLICSLIWATCSNIRQLDMPGGEVVYLSGFDGIVQCDGGNAFVPPGLSVWELGTDKNVTSKANSDSDKRTKDSGKICKKDASFVFATPCRWPTHSKWKAEKNIKTPWKQVHGLCSHHLERWINTVPWIAALFATSALNKHITGFRTIEMIWNDCADIPHPNGYQLNPDFILADRERIRDELKNWLLKKDIPSMIRTVIQIGYSPEQAVKICEMNSFNYEQIRKAIFLY